MRRRQFVSDFFDMTIYVDAEEADIEQWFVERACDGYVAGGTHVPGTFEDFVQCVVPEWQRRGIFQPHPTLER